MVSNLGRIRLRQNQAHSLRVVVAAKALAAVRNSFALSLLPIRLVSACVCE